MLCASGRGPYVRVRWDGEHRVEGDPAWLRLEAVEGNGGETRTGDVRRVALGRGDARGRQRPARALPLFYEATPDSIRVSPSLVRLLLEGASRELDEAALAVFLRCGFFVSGTDAVPRDPGCATGRDASLVPGAKRRWIKSRTACQCGKPRARGGHGRGRGDRGAGDPPAADRRGAGHAPSSGGRDSRQLLFEMVRQGVRPRLTVTAQHFPPRRNEDTILARRIAAELGLPHRVVKQPPRRLPLEVRNHIETSFCSDEGAWADAMKGTILAEGSETCDGIAGDSQMGHPPWLGWNADRETTLCGSRTLCWTTRRARRWCGSSRDLICTEGCREKGFSGRGGRVREAQGGSRSGPALLLLEPDAARDRSGAFREIQCDSGGTRSVLRLRAARIPLLAAGAGVPAEGFSGSTPSIGGTPTGRTSPWISPSRRRAA